MKFKIIKLKFHKKKFKRKKKLKSNKSNIIFKIFTILILIIILLLIRNLNLIHNILFHNNNFNNSKNSSIYFDNINISQINPEIIKLYINNTKIVQYKGQYFPINKILNYYAYYLPDKNFNTKLVEINKSNRYLSLEELPEEPKLLLEIKQKLLNSISKNAHKNLTRLDTIFVTRYGRFGNTLVSFNNVIFYCELLGCKQIILNEYKYKNSWFIKNEIFSSDRKKRRYSR